jgi:hypothetical protein
MATKKKVTRLDNVTASKEEKAIARKSDTARKQKTSAVRAGKAANATSLGDVSVASSLEEALRGERAAELASRRKADEELSGSEDTGPKRVREGTFKGLGQDKGDWETGRSVSAAHDEIAARVPTSKHANLTSVVRDPWGSGNPVAAEGTGMRQHVADEGKRLGMSDEEMHIKLVRDVKGASPKHLPTAKAKLSAHVSSNGHAYGVESICEGPTCNKGIPFEKDQDYCAGDSCATEAQRSTPTPRPKA